jgi:hypothetical protein
VKSAHVLAVISVVASAGCLWLFPIQKEEATGSSGPDGSIDLAGADGSSGGTESGAQNGAGQCTRNSDCGQDFTLCRARTCLALRSEECLLVRGNWNDPNAFIFGAYATEPMAAPETSQAIYNYELALNEFNAVGGLPDGNGNNHPLAAVICNNDPKQAALVPDFYGKSLRHLVDDLGVSAIVADLAPDELKTAFHTTVSESKSVFFLNPGAANNDLLSLMDNGLVWSMLGPPKDLADGYAALVRRIEKYIRSTSDAGTTPLRVAVVLKDDPNEVDHELLTELYDAVEPNLFFNAAPAMNQLGGNYREFHINAGDAGATSDAGTPTPSDVADAVNDYAPHIVISMTGTDFTSIPSLSRPEGVAHRMLTFVKGGGPDRLPWVQHEYPFFIFSPINAAATSDFSALLLSSTALDYPVIYQRFLGINVAGADDRDVLGEYQERLRNYQKLAADGFENYYDAIYYLAYAVYRAGVVSIDGSNISAGMSSLSSGVPLKVGPMEVTIDGGVNQLIEQVFHELKASGSVQLIGASGSQFDVPHGVRIDKAGLYCFEYNNGSTPISHQPAEIFDAILQKWTVLALAQCTPGL